MSLTKRTPELQAPSEASGAPVKPTEGRGKVIRDTVEPPGGVGVGCTAGRSDRGEVSIALALR